MGKTSVLRSITDAIDDAGGLVIRFEATQDEELAKRLTQAMSLELRKRRRVSSAFSRALRVFRSFQVKVDPDGAWSFGLDVEPEQGYADSGNFSLDLQDLLRALGEAAREDGSVVLLAVDELQEAEQKDLRALNVALHALGQDGRPLPVSFIGAGLPALPAELANASTYAERMFRYFSIGLLDDDEAAEALVGPSHELGVSWDDTALDITIEAAGGYPFFIQQYGSCVWDQRVDGGVITGADAQAGILLAREEIDRGLYRSRWDRIAGQERDFLVAMSGSDGATPISEIASLMHTKVTSLSATRQRLIDAGQIWSPERGKVAFTVPGMSDFIRRNAGE